MAYSWSRGDCDKGFLNDMLTLCTSKGRRKRRNLQSVLQAVNGKDMENIGRIAKEHLMSKRFVKTCKWTAYVFYYTVVNFGGPHYEKISPAWCDEVCVLKAGKPNINTVSQDSNLKRSYAEI